VSEPVVSTWPTPERHEGHERDERHPSVEPLDPPDRRDRPDGPTRRRRRLRSDRLRAVPPAIDRAAASAAVRDLLVALGRDPSSAHLARTPDRLGGALAELLSPTAFELTTFPNDEGYDELIVARDIPFHSLCEHHLLPFVGVAHVGYIPADRILGLSKLARTVEHFARDLQVQERLTNQIAGFLHDELQPKGVGVVLEADHLCMSLRGVQASGARTVTSAVHGLLRQDPRARQEFFALTGGSR
jgi:GTP cyclohydrolase IA